jgi:hypothetical protein
MDTKCLDVGAQYFSVTPVCLFTAAQNSSKVRSPLCLHQALHWQVRPQGSLAECPDKEATQLSPRLLP